MVLIGVSLLFLGGVFALLDTVSQGDMSMAGILDRLRQSYPDRSGKELDQTLNALPWVMVVIGSIVTVMGLLSSNRAPVHSMVSS